MKALVVVAVMLSAVTVAKANECKPFNDAGYTFSGSGDYWTNKKATIRFTDADAVVKSAKGTRTFTTDMTGTDPTGFGLHDASMGKFDFYAVFFGDSPRGNFTSPELAKWTGGSATFIRKCK